MKNKQILKTKFPGKAPTKQEQILNCLKERILSGKMRPGDRFSTRNELIREFGVSVVTMQRTVDRLRDDGFIVARGRLGSFVTDSPPHLCRYGLVFPCNPMSQEVNGSRWLHMATSSRFMDAMVQVAAKFNGKEGRELVCYMGADRELNTPSYQRLVGDIRARRLAGVMFLHPNSSYTPELLEGSGIPGGIIGDPPMKNFPGSIGLHFDMESFLDKSLDFMVQQGRRRIALLVISSIWEGSDLVQHFHKAAAARGLTTGPHSVLGLDPQNPGWARNAALILLKQSRSLRPDGLIISDDHLVSAATQGLLDSGVPVPRELSVLAHCNYVSDVPSSVHVTQLGFDLVAALDSWIELIEAKRRGEKISPLTRIEPVFESNADSISRN